MKGNALTHMIDSNVNIIRKWRWQQYEYAKFVSNEGQLNGRRITLLTKKPETIEGSWRNYYSGDWRNDPIEEMDGQWPLSQLMTAWKPARTILINEMDQWCENRNTSH